MKKIQIKLLKVLLITIGVLLSPLQNKASNTDYYQKVCIQPELHTGLENFLTYIFNILPAKPLTALIDGITTQTVNDEETYHQLIQLLPSAAGYTVKVPAATTVQAYPFAYRVKLLYRSFLSLKTQVDEMTRQTQKIVGTQPIQGYLEIGTPGRYVNSLKKALTIAGPIFIMPTNQSTLDMFERKSITSVGKALPLTYQPINPADIPSESLDLITCYIGLHHAPAELLNDFIASLHRVLRPGGMLIIRDHNGTEELMPLLHVVHSVYNAVTGASKEDEKNEIRNFQPIQYWIETITEHGFSVSSAQLFQENDPTENTLLCFTKHAPSQAEDDILDIKKEIVSSKEPYERELVATYLTPIEWRSVDELQNLSLFLNHTPWYQYPFLTSIRSFWKHTANNTRTAYQLFGAKQAFFSSAAITNFFIGSVMTGLYTQLGVLAAGPRFMYSLPGNADALTVKAIVFDPHKQLTTLEKDGVKIIKLYETGITLVELPRYLPFTNLIQKITALDIEIIEIAGHKELCIQLEAPDSEAAFIAPTKCTVLHATPTLPGKEAFPRMEVKVPLTELKAFFKSVQESGYSVIHIFDY